MNASFITAIAVADEVKEDELKKVVVDESRYFKVKTFDELQNGTFMNTFIKGVCDEAKKSSKCL